MTTLIFVLSELRFRKIVTAKKTTFLKFDKALFKCRLFVELILSSFSMSRI